MVQLSNKEIKSIKALASKKFRDETGLFVVEGEKMVQEALDKVMVNRTVFAIAHRLATVRHADKILVMKNGRIVESGTHESLMEQNGVYRHLYVTQFQK